MQFKLANIVLDAGGFLEDHEDLLYRSSGTPCMAQADYKTSAGELEFSGVLDFCTYLNAFSLAKWRQYTSLENLFVHVELVGDDCDIALVRVDKNAHCQTEVLTNMYASNTCQAFDVAISIDSAVLVGLQLASAGATRVRNAYFYTEVSRERVRPIHLALATTTFNNEDYIVPNIKLIKNQVLGSSEAIAQHFYMFVMDNGQSLDAQALSSEGITVMPNLNVGGSGGFARGMLEALGEGASGKPEEAFTHVLLMDDDVRVFPESFIRTFNLLSLANEQYKDAFVQGAMLKLQEPNIQYEDVAYVKRTSGYERIKTTLDVSQLASIVENETTSVEREHTYGAWWYSCIPVSAIRARGLPLPFFIRIDDVEYGAREPSVYMTLAGICVWHSQFLGRFRASVDLYQYGRNMLIAMACSNIADARAFMAKYWRNLAVYLRFMCYENAELWLDALEDYLKGPAWFASVDGAELMKRNAQKNEKLVPVEELDQELLAACDINMDWIGREMPPQNPIFKAIEALPYSRHLLPRFLLKNIPAAVDYGSVLSPPAFTARRHTLVALDTAGEKGHIRTLDKARYKQLMRRYKALRRSYVECADEIAARYCAARPYLTSVGFWKEYLGLN